MSYGNYKKHSWTRFKNCKGAIKDLGSTYDENTKLYWCPKRSYWSPIPCDCEMKGARPKKEMEQKIKFVKKRSLKVGDRVQIYSEPELSNCKEIESDSDKYSVRDYASSQIYIWKKPMASVICGKEFVVKEIFTIASGFYVEGNSYCLPMWAIKKVVKSRSKASEK